MTSFPWIVARRYLTARRKQAFISLISIVSVLGVGIGVAATIISLALMTGLQTEMRDRIVGSVAHIYIQPTGDARFTDFNADAARIAATPGVTGVAPAIIGKGLLQSTAERSAFITIKGVDISRETTVTQIASGMKAGALDSLNRREDQTDGIVLGVDLAASLGLHVGDSVSIITPDGPTSPMGRMRGYRRFEVVGLFQLGFFEFDSGYGLIALPVAQQFLRREGYDFLQASVADMYDAPRVATALQETLGLQYAVQDWTEMNKSLYSALVLEKLAISMTIGLVVMVAALNIVASLVLLVMEKSRDIAILRTMGAPASAIRRIFMLQGLVIGLIGTLAGTLLGVGASFILDRYRLLSLPGEVYQITHLPFRVEPLDVAVVVATAVTVCFLATLYPSRQAGRLDPAEGLRYQ
jgi:lipoprotein-releasing system permease protein